VIVVGVFASAQLSGRFGLDLVTRRIPTTLTGEIKLDTPSEFVMLEFAIASNLILNVDFGFARLNVDAVVNTAGPEHCVIKAPMNFGELSFYEITFDKLSIVPEMWFAVPFEAVTDVNNLPNSVIIPPGDVLFVKARVTFSTSIAGFNITHLAMLEDINFPNPGSSYTPLYYPVQSQSFAIGSLTSASWRAQMGCIGEREHRSGRIPRGKEHQGLLRHRERRARQLLRPIWHKRDQTGRHQPLRHEPAVGDAWHQLHVYKDGHTGDWNNGIQHDD